MKKGTQTSYGIVLYTKVNEEYFFLCGKRRDTIPYIDFLLVKYENRNLRKYFSLMTKEEKHRLLSYSFDDIWNNLWVSHNCVGYTSRYLRSKQHFEQFKESGKLKQYIEESESVLQPSWEFPKGKKKSYREKDIDCALREFTEETTIPSSTITLTNFKPQIIVTIGSNDKRYKTVYFVAFVPEPIYVAPKRCLNMKECEETVSDEFSELKWVSLSEAKKYVDINKVRVLKNVVKCLNVPHLSKKSLDKIRSLIEHIKTENS